MNRFGYLLAVLVCVSLSSVAMGRGRHASKATTMPATAPATVPASAPATVPASATATMPAFAAGEDVLANPYYRNIIRECKLSDAQVTSLREKVQAKHDALKAWDDGEKGRKLTAALQGVLKTQNAKDGEASRVRLVAPSGWRAQLEDKLQADAMSVLTARQANTWKGYELYTTSLARLGRKLRDTAPLDDKQKATIRDICNAAAPDAIKARGDDNAVKQVRKELNKKIADEVLTADQKQLLQSKAASRPSKHKGHN